MHTYSSKFLLSLWSVLFHVSNCISRDGMEAVAVYLKGNPPLKHLNIGYNRAEDDGAIYLSEAFAGGNMSLRT